MEIPPEVEIRGSRELRLGQSVGGLDGFNRVGGCWGVKVSG